MTFAVMASELRAVKLAQQAQPMGVYFTHRLSPFHDVYVHCNANYRYYDRR
jgi:hypothetical protein